MEILSVTNKKTQLHKSPSDLSVICAHEHTQKRTVSSDVSFFLSSYTPKCFLQTYKTDTLEWWRVKTAKDGTETFDRMKKWKIDGIQAIAANKTKDSNPEYAVGYTTGQIQVLELKDKSTLIHDFEGDRTNNASVVSLDFSACGNYVSSVYENGIVNIYGLTTKIRADTVKAVDRDSSLARFSPARRSHLAIASFKGGVTVYDMFTKRIHFQQKDAHDAPCRDVAMPEDIPDRLLSCGCDSLIKIFDTRQKSTALQIQSSCGLSTISVTKCGGFFAVGNLKGDIITYDMRSLRQPLTKMKVDNELVTRIAFMPIWGESDNQITSLEGGNSSESILSDELPDVPDNPHDFTMEDLVGFQKGRISDFETSVVSRVSIGQYCGDETRLSSNFGRNVKNAINELSFDENFDENSVTPARVESNSLLDRIKRVTVGKKESLPKRRSSLMPSPLQRIREEHVDKENCAGSLNKGTPTSGPRFSSTPTLHSINKLSFEAPEIKDEYEVIDVDALDSSSEATQEPNKKIYTTETLVPPYLPAPSSFPAQQFDVDFKKEFNALHEKTEKIHFEVQSLNMDSNGRHLEMMTYIFNQRRELQSRIQMVEECMAILMTDDVKINRIMELQEENRDLRHQLDEILKRLNR